MYWCRVFRRRIHQAIGQSCSWQDGFDGEDVYQSDEAAALGSLIHVTL